MTSRPLRYLYVLASLLPGRATVVSAQHDAPGYALGFVLVGLLLLVAAARDYLAAQRHRRAAAVRAERAARPGPYTGVAHDMDDCCETWWTSAGTRHDVACATHHKAA